MNDNTPQEIIKEYIVSVDGLNHKVKGRIVKDIKGETDHLYLGQLSHYCKQDETAVDIYIPSILGREYNRAEHLLLRYLEKFRNIDVTENKNY